MTSARLTDGLRGLARLPAALPRSARLRHPQAHVDQRRGEGGEAFVAVYFGPCVRYRDYDLGAFTRVAEDFGLHMTNTPYDIELARAMDGHGILEPSIGLAADIGERLHVGRTQ